MSKANLKKRIEALEEEKLPEKRLRIAFHVSTLAIHPDDPPGTDPAQRYRDAGLTFINENGEEYAFLGELPSRALPPRETRTDERPSD